MFRWQRPHLVLSIYGLLVSTSAFISVLILFQIPSDSKNSIFLGLSLQRLVMISGMSLAGILSAVFTVKAYRNISWANQVWSLIFGQKMLAWGIRWVAVAGAMLGWIVYFTPLYRWGNYQEYFLRISPLIVWLTFISILTFIISWIEKYSLHWLNFANIVIAQKKILTITLFSLTVFILIWIFIATTGMGLWVRDGYWYGAGVPILGLQILFAFAIGMGVFFIEKSAFKKYIPSGSERFVFFLVWGVAAFLWAREPLKPSFFAPGPYLPDLQYHPYSDAATFDLGSQFALIGQGINNGVYFDRALYMAFLVFLHRFVGQDYVQVVALQAAIYAIFPAILYLLGKAVQSRAFGAILAVLTILRGINGIAASTIIDLANQKQMMTDFPTVIFVAWVCLMLVRWLKDPNKNYLYAIWAGGIIGLAIMLRTNVLFLLLFIALLAAIVYWRQKLRGILIVFLVLAAMFASTFAWGAYNDKSVFDIYIYRILIVLRARYSQPVTPIPAISQKSVAPLFNMADTTDRGMDMNISFPIKDPLKPHVALPTQRSLETYKVDSKLSSIPAFVTIHFLHNIIASVFILPTSVVFHDLWHTVKQVSPFWGKDWDGSLTVSVYFFLTLNLLLIALGIGVSWKSAKLPGLVPLGVFIFYNLANALARTSGGRYIVPMDWVVVFYFVLGLFQIMILGMALFGLKDDEVKLAIDHHDNEHAPWIWVPLKKVPVVIMVFLLIGTSLPLSEQFFPKRYSNRSQTELFTLLEQEGYIQKMGFDGEKLQAAAEQWPNFKVFTGRALYPRYFPENEGIPKNRVPYSTMGFPRIAFTMVGLDGISYVILPEDRVPYFPNASDVFILGCQEDGYIDALAVIVIEQQAIIYVRQPVSPLECPMKLPICDENQVCH